MIIQCSNCGGTHSFDYSANNVLHAVYTLGWGSYGSALYCPECSNSWEGRNKGRPQAGPDNTIRVIDSLYQPDRGRHRNKTIVPKLDTGEERQ